MRRPRTFGAHAIALTPEGKVILVKLRYARGWGLPGGGRKPGEPGPDAALRELREEIGMTSHGEVQLAGEIEQAVDFKRDLDCVLIVRDVRYTPRWSWEVEAVIEGALDDLPADITRFTARWLERLRPSLQCE